MKAERYTDESKSDADFECILQWIRLVSCKIHHYAAGFEEHRKNLAARGETSRRLQEFDHWRESSAFTEREKAALSLSESMSLNQSETLSQAVLKEAKRHFNRT